jgi:bifunctional non-homologous end joining protein LigD
MNEAEAGGGGRQRATKTVEVAGRQLSLSNLDKVLWPATGTTKGDMVGYYSAVAPVMLPHLSGRPVTLRRFPDGVEGESFFEKNCPSHRPSWVGTAKMGDVSYCLIEEPAALVWTANLAAIELHPTLAAVPHLDQPSFVVFDLDPGEPAGILQCARVALLVRDILGQLALECWPKTSGSKGLQLYAPLNNGSTYAESEPFAKAVAKLLERRHADLVVSQQQKSARKGKVLIDWSQNSPSRTTVCAYSMRARPTPTVSTPVTWGEIERSLAEEDEGALTFRWERVLDRVERLGDLMAEVLERRQELPDLGKELSGLR